MNLNKAKQLARDHWAYIKQLLLTHGVPIEQVNIIGFHYKSAFIHGYKHGYEDAANQTIQIQSDNNTDQMPDLDEPYDWRKGLKFR